MAETEQKQSENRQRVETENKNQLSNRFKKPRNFGQLFNNTYDVEPKMISNLQSKKQEQEQGQYI